MKDFLKKVLYVVRVIWGVSFALAAVGGIIMGVQEKQWAYFLLSALLLALAFLLIHRRKPKAVDQPTITASIADVEALEPVAPTEPVDAYIDTGNIIYRTDGKPIEDREVPYLIEMGYRKVLERPMGAPADATPEELAFLSALEGALKVAHKSPVYSVRRMSNKALEVRAANYHYLGKIKLQGRKTWMQYPKRGGDFDTLEDATLQEYIALLPRWARLA